MNNELLEQLRQLLGEKMTKQEKMTKLARACDWRSALMILNERFAGDARVWEHVDLDRQSIFFEEILSDGTFSGGEIRLLRIAASLFSTDFKVNLWHVLNGLDDDNAGLVIRAIASFCGGPDLDLQSHL